MTPMIWTVFLITIITQPFLTLFMEFSRGQTLNQQFGVVSSEGRMVVSGGLEFAGGGIVWKEEGCIVGLFGKW